MKNLSRRAFLKLSGAALLAAGLTGTLTACGGTGSIDIPGTVNGIGYVSGSANRTILGTQEYGTIHVVKVVVTLKNVSSRAVTLTADNFPAEIDHSAASPIYFGFADNASGDSWWTQKDYELQPNEEKNGMKIFTRSSFGKGYVLADVYDVRQTSGRELKHTALQPDSKEMTEALKTLINYSVVPLVSEESIPIPAIYSPEQMKLAINPGFGDAEAFAGIATEIAHARFHAKGYNQNYTREDYELDAQSVGYMICRRFGVPCEAPDTSNLAALYDGFEPQDRRQALGQIQDMAQKIGGSIEKAISPQVRNRNMSRNAR